MVLQLDMSIPDIATYYQVSVKTVKRRYRLTIKKKLFAGIHSLVQKKSKQYFVGCLLKAVVMQLIVFMWILKYYAIVTQVSVYLKDVHEYWNEWISKIQKSSD